MIKVLLADDHTVVRDGIRFLLEAQGDIKVTATASNGQEAVEQALLDCPDVIVMDFSMPVMNGIEATQQICALCPHTQIMILSMYHTAEHVQRAVKAGAVGYLLKDSAGTELVRAIRALHDGKRYFSQKISNS
ncbi:MAG TPA: response regulator transcription factor [Anaerolineales bacterium]